MVCVILEVWRQDLGKALWIYHEINEALSFKLMHKEAHMCAPLQNKYLILSLSNFLSFSYYDGPLSSAELQFHDTWMPQEE